MSEKTQISINDFDLFHETIKSASKIVESAKITINDTGLVIYGAKARTARCEITTNSVYSQNEVAFSILNMNMFVRILQTIKDVHENDYTNFKFFVDMPFLRFESKKFKTKLITCNEDVIGKWVSTKLKAQMTPVFEFTTSSDMIKRINSHTFVFSDSEKLRIYLETNKDMENNAVFATIGNKESDLNNQMTLKIGLATFGKLEDRELIIDSERLNLLNTVQSNDIKISLMDINVLVSKTTLTGKNSSFFDMTVYNTLLKM